MYNIAHETVVFITGSSRGIGEHIANHLQSKGYIVYGSSRNTPQNADKRHLQLDVTDKMACERAIQQVLAEQGRIDILINNAGFHLTGAAEENTVDELCAQMDLNFYGTVNMIKAILPLFLAQKSGKIINMSSIGGLLSLPYTSAYNASKFALEGYTEALRLELLAFGIYVSNLEPGYVNTGTTDQSIGHPKNNLPLFSKYRQQLHQQMEDSSLKGTPMQVISDTCEEIIQAKKPKFRYKISGMSKMLSLLKAILPQNFFEKTVLKSFNLPTTINY
jgi:short-subunit dehydrogenase